MKGSLARRLLALTDLDSRLRVVAEEGALAAEDRARLLRMAWDEEKKRLRLLSTLVVAVTTLTMGALALLSLAMAVHFWDSPQRVTAVWSMAGVWSVLWLGTLFWLISVLRDSSGGMGRAWQEFARDWHWARAQIVAQPRDPESREPHPATREELLARIERQRDRIARLQEPAPVSGAVVRQASSLREALVEAAREHPVAMAAVAVGVAAGVGPGRLLRWAAWLFPMVLRMR